MTRRYANRVDANQPKLVTQLRRIPGVSVVVTSALGKGFPDIVVGFRNTSFMFEIKDGAKKPSAQKLTDDEVIFRDNWTGHYAVAKTLDDVLDVLGLGKSWEGK